MIRRSGITLTEVLVAIFIMGIGLLSLLVLFPLGAINMSQAIKDQRAADASRTAASIYRIWNVGNDNNVHPLYTNPGGGLTDLSTAAGYNRSSYPVYVDPIGYLLTGAGPPAPRVGAVGAGKGFRRVDHSSITSVTAATRWMTLLDELIFEESGAPKATGGTVQRDPRYSWAYLCRQVRPTATPVGSSPAGIELTVVVYDRRPFVLGSNGLPAGETNYEADFGTPAGAADLARITFTAGTTPAVKRGTWIMDATIDDSTATSPKVAGYFYRVVGITGQTATTMTLQLSRPVVANATRGTGNPGKGVAVVFENVIEVFEKGPF